MKEADIDSINVSAKRYNYVVSSVISRNHDKIDKLMLRGENPQDDNSAFRMDDNFM